MPKLISVEYFSFSSLKYLQLLRSRTEPNLSSPLRFQEKWRQGWGVDLHMV